MYAQATRTTTRGRFGGSKSRLSRRGKQFRSEHYCGATGAKRLETEIQLIEIAREKNLNEAISEVARTGTKALLIGSSSYFNSHSKQLGELLLPL